MEKREQLYEGKAKKIFRTSDPNLYWVEYKDDATAFNGEKKGTILGKGELNNRISSIFFTVLREKGIDNHFVKRLSETEQLVRRVEIIPIEVVVRNIAAGSLAKRLGFKEGTPLSQPVVEFYYKNDDLGDPLINHYHVKALGIASEAEMAALEKISLNVNEVLRGYLAQRKVILVDFKLEFGRSDEGILLADEISPDTCRFWDMDTQEKLDKDRFRRDLGNVAEAYQEMLRRLGGENHV